MTNETRIIDLTVGDYRQIVREEIVSLLGISKEREKVDIKTAAFLAGCSTDKIRYTLKPCEKGRGSAPSLYWRDEAEALNHSKLKIA